MQTTLSQTSTPAEQLRCVRDSASSNEIGSMWWRNIFRAPRQVGSIMPSSQRLAQRMAWHAADFIPRDAPGCVIEIGAGTGAITDALATAMPNTPLMLVEADPACCRYLRHRFPRAEVIEGLVENLRHRLAPPCHRLVLVSSVPLFSLKRAQRNRVLDVFESLVERAEESRVVQYTYVPWLPGHRARWLCGHAVQSVWQNTPPAWVWNSTHHATQWNRRKLLQCSLNLGPSRIS